MFDQRKNAEKNDRFSAGDDDHFFGRNIHPARLAHVLRDRLSQLWQTGGRSVVRETVAHGIGSGIDDVTWRIEVRLADFEMNNVAPLRFQRFCFHQNFERGLGPEPRHPFGETQFALCGHVHNRDYSASAQHVL